MGLTAHYEDSYRRSHGALRDVLDRTPDELQQEQLITKWLNLTLSQRAQRKQAYVARQRFTWADRSL